MPTRSTFYRLAKLPLAISLASSLGSTALAASFTIGEIEGQLDSTLSVGSSWSTADPDSNLIGVNNGGKGLSQTTDDSRQNFKKGETFSKIFKGIHDLELKYGDIGVFTRGKYWYDFELKDENRLFKDIDDHNRKEGSQSSGAQLLDAFAYYNYDVLDQPGSVRLGKQVVSWGESTFIQNGINSINPVDVSAFRRPGAEVKEGLIPVNMFYVQQSLTENLSAEAFYQLEWDQSTLDNCGTFFAQPDVASDGCDQNFRVLTNNAARIAGLNAGLPANMQLDQTAEGILVRRSADRDARDAGQWGAAMRYMFEPLDTEFGAYFMNYHSRAPVLSYTYADQAVYDTAATKGSLASAVVAGNTEYFIEYPEDIRLYGLSFSTTLPTGTAWSGEISYRPNAPVSMNTTDQLYGALDPLKGLNPLFGNASVVDGTPGTDMHGYRRKEITQFQTTFTHFFDRVMGASRFTLLGEVGVTHVGGLESTSDIRYGRDPVFGPGNLAPTGVTDTCQALNNSTLNGAGGNSNRANLQRNCESDGYVTSTSWGYRARAIWDYNNAIAGVNLKPNVAWSHDVNGYGPNGLFTEGAKAISLGLDADYSNTYTASINYTNFFDGKYNTAVDRDFLAVSVGVSF